MLLMVLHFLACVVCSFELQTLVWFTEGSWAGEVNAICTIH